MAYPVYSVRNGKSFCLTCFKFVSDHVKPEHVAKHRNELGGKWFCKTCWVTDEEGPVAHRRAVHHSYEVPSNFMKRVCITCQKTTTTNCGNNPFCVYIKMEEYCYSLVEPKHLPRLIKALKRFLPMNVESTLPRFEIRHVQPKIEIPTDIEKCTKDLEDLQLTYGEHVTKYCDTMHAEAKEGKYSALLFKEAGRLYKEKGRLYTDSTIGPIWREGEITLFLDAHKMVPIDRTKGFVLMEKEIAMKHYPAEILAGELAYSNGYFICKRNEYQGVLGVHDVVSVVSTLDMKEKEELDASDVPVLWNVAHTCCRFTFMGPFRLIGKTPFEGMIEAYLQLYDVKFVKGTNGRMYITYQCEDHKFKEEDLPAKEPLLETSEEGKETPIMNPIASHIWKECIIPSVPYDDKNIIMAIVEPPADECEPYSSINIVGDGNVHHVIDKEEYDTQEIMTYHTPKRMNIFPYGDSIFSVNTSDSHIGHRDPVRSDWNTTAVEPYAHVNNLDLAVNKLPRLDDFY